MREGKKRAICQQAYDLSSISSMKRESTFGSCPLAKPHFLWHTFALSVYSDMQKYISSTVIQNHIESPDSKPLSKK